MTEEKKPTAADRTLPMWDDPADRPVEPEERSQKSRSDFDPDEPLVRWVSEASGDVRGKPRLVRVAKFKNGRRGLQLVRGDSKHPEQSSTLVLHFAEYLMLAQCIFRDSRHIQDLISRYPVGTDPTVDGIRDFLSVRIDADL